MRFRIDLKIFIFLIIFYFTKQIEVYSILMIFALIHELGHLLAGLLLGMKPEKLDLMPFGISISFKIKAEEYNQKIKKGNKLEVKKILVALAGPITNFVMIIVACNLKVDIFKSLIIIYSNFLIMIFNLLPIYPLDGGRILKGILHINFGKQRAEKYINCISKMTVALITVCTAILILYVHNVAFVLIVAYLWYLILKEDRIYKRREQLRKMFLN